jgi:DNA-binding transcriptional ArsR family regulator
MREVVQIRELETARAALSELRVAILERLREPRTCAELAESLELSPQAVHHHLKELLRVGLIRIAKRRKVRNLTEAIYQAVGKAYWLSPQLVRAPATRERDDLSLHNLLGIAESMHEDVAALLDRSEEREVPSLGFTVDIRLRSEAERSAFANEVLAALKPVVERYQGKSAAAHPYKLRLVVYPSPNEDRKP